MVNKLLQLLYISKCSEEFKRLVQTKDIITVFVLQDCLSKLKFT